MALLLAEYTYTPIPFFLSLSLEEMTEYAEIVNEKPQ